MKLFEGGLTEAALRTATVRRRARRVGWALAFRSLCGLALAAVSCRR